MQNTTESISDLDLEGIRAAANTVRGLAMDAVEASGTGHPGMPMGLADVGVALYGEILNHYHRDPSWLNRDRFVLSAGHGSVLQYALLHLAGFGLSLEEIARLRRAGSLTPGHPEYRLTAGVEATTGPLGAGFATAVGMAIAETRLAEEFNTGDYRIIDHYTYVISGDGCMMEGVTSEAASLAGHLKLGKLIVFYDSNEVSIEGPVSITFTEDVGARFRAYGWQTFEGDAYDIPVLLSMVEEAKADIERPTLIVLHSRIGKGSPGMEGNHHVHGTALGESEIRSTKKALGMPENKKFHVEPKALEYFSQRQQVWAKRYERWNRIFGAWSEENPELKVRLDRYLDQGRAWYGDTVYPNYRSGDSHSTRDVSGAVLNAIAKSVPNFIGGSADLSTSNKSEMPGLGDYQPAFRRGRTLRFGVREHAMGSIANGILLHGGFRPFTATLFVFIDYMRPAIRLAAIMELPVIYVLTHDSIYLGGDGPTHQPVEHLNALRLIPGVHVLRPGDPEETVAAWQMALERRNGPTALVLSRQGLAVYQKADPEWRSTLRRGAYTVRDAGATPDAILLATGSEVQMALEAADRLGQRNCLVRVISVISRELLLAQPDSFREGLMRPGVPVFVVEAGSAAGWEAFTSGRRDRIFSIERFGVSGRPEEVAEYLNFTVDSLVQLIARGLK